MKTLKFQDKATLSKVKTRVKTQDGAAEDMVYNITKSLKDLESKISRSQVIPLKKELLQQVKKVESELKKLKDIASKSDDMDDEDY